MRGDSVVAKQPCCYHSPWLFLAEVVMPRRVRPAASPQRVKTRTMKLHGLCTDLHLYEKLFSVRGDDGSNCGLPCAWVVGTLMVWTTTLGGLVGHLYRTSPRPIRYNTDVVISPFINTYSGISMFLMVSYACLDGIQTSAGLNTIQVSRGGGGMSRASGRV